MSQTGPPASGPPADDPAFAWHDQALAGPTSHRAPATPAATLRRLAPPLAAVTSVVVVVVALILLNGNPTKGRDGAVVGGGAPRTPTVLATSATTPPPAPTPTTTLPVQEPPATASPAAVKLPVTVLNNSRVHGLAHDAADQLRAGGWPIRSVGNYRGGRVAESTVYYAPGQLDSAKALARQFSAVKRILPRFRGLPGQGLTLVVTRDWPH